MNTQEKFKRGICAECGNQTKHRRSWFCDDICKWKNRFFPHPSKRNTKHFYLYTGSSMPKGQGKRSGSMVAGSMGIGVVPNWDLVVISKENLDRHFSRLPAYYSDRNQLGSGDYVSKETIYQMCITLDNP